MGKYDKKPGSPRGARTAPREPQQTSNPARASAPVTDNPELQDIARWLSTVKFRKKAVGGLDPADVWKKIEELNGLYEKALSAERVRCNLLIRQVRLSAKSAPQEEPDGEE